MRTKWKQSLAGLLALVMLLTLLPMSAIAAGSNEPIADDSKFGVVFAQWDDVNQKYYKDPTMSRFTGCGMSYHPQKEIYLEYVDAQGKVSNVSASDLTVSGSDIMSISDLPNSDGGIQVNLHGIGDASLIYHDGTNSYRTDYHVFFEDYCFYTTPQATIGSYIHEAMFRVTESAKTFYIVTSNGCTLSDVRLVGELDNIADVTLNPSGTVAAITITGVPQNRNYQLECSGTRINGSQTEQFQDEMRIIWLENQLPGLRMRWPDFSGSVPSEDPGAPLNSEITGMLYGSNEIFLYYVNGSSEQKVAATAVSSSNQNVVRVSAHPDVADMAVLEYVGIGNADITYTLSNNQTVTLPVSVQLPDVACYSSNTNVNTSTYLKEFTLTNTNNTFYLVATNGYQLTQVSLEQPFDTMGSVTMSSDGSYATVTLREVPQSGIWCGVTYSATHAQYRPIDDRTEGIKVIDERSYLKFRRANISNGAYVENVNSSLRNLLTTTKGAASAVYCYFVDAGAEHRVFASQLTSSDPSVVTVEQNPNDSNCVMLKAVGFGDAQISYTVGNETYSFEVQVRLPEVSLYKAPAATEANYIREFTVTDTEDTFYLVAKDGWTLTAVSLHNGLDSIANVTISSDATYAAIQVTGNFSGNRWADIQYSAEQKSTGRISNGMWEGLLLGSSKTGFGFRFADFGPNGQFEDKTKPLIFDFTIDKGKNEPVYFNLVQGSAETGIAITDLVSSNPAIVNLATYEGTDAVILEALDFGTAQISYTAGGKTYSVELTVDLPDFGAYTGTTVNRTDFITEKMVQGADNSFYILAKNGETIQSVDLIDDFASVASVSVDASGQFAKVTVHNPAPARDFSYRVWYQGQNNTQEEHWCNIRIVDGNPYIGYCWPDDGSSTGRSPIERYLNTAKGYATDVWVYYVENGKETKLSLKDLTSSDPSVVEVVDPGYDDGMLNLKTTGWGTAQVSYQKGGQTYSINVESELQEFGYYTSTTASQESWIREFTNEDKVIYFISRGDACFDALYPTAALEEIADCTISSDRKMVTITIKGTPNMMEAYGFEPFLVSNSQGEAWGSVDLIEYVDKTITQAEVSKEAADIAQKQVQKLVEEILSGNIEGSKLAESVSEETLKAMKDELEAGNTIMTEVVAIPLTKEEAQADMGADVALIEQETGGEKTVLQYFDISVYIISVSQDGSTAALLGTMNQVSEKMRFQLTLPEDTVTEGKEFYVLRVHDGKTDKLPTGKNADGTLYFETDKYSTYALIAEDVQSQGGNQGSSEGDQSSDHNDSQNSGTAEGSTGQAAGLGTAAATGDPANGLWFAVLAVAVSGLLYLAGDRNKRKMK